jgi:hypothetical protein
MSSLCKFEALMWTASRHKEELTFQNPDHEFRHEHHQVRDRTTEQAPQVDAKDSVDKEEFICHMKKLSRVVFPVEKA